MSRYMQIIATVFISVPVFLDELNETHMNSGKGKINLTTILPLPAAPVVPIPGINQNLLVNQAFRPRSYLNHFLNCTSPFHPQFQCSERASIDPLGSYQIRSDEATTRINLSIHPAIHPSILHSYNLFIH